ncbi:MAG: RNA methyltransferase [Opitutaceae bacterium]
MITKAEIQRLRSLREKKSREQQGVFVIEGEKVVAELLAANFPFERIYATPSWPGFRPGERPVPATPPQNPLRATEAIVAISEEEMVRASHFPTPSSVLAIGKIVRTSLEPGALDHGLTLALDGVQDAGNVGTLLRVADWFGLDRVVLSPDCADLFHQKVINASMGSFARVQVHTAELASVLSGVTVPVLGCALSGDSAHALPRLGDAVLVIGSEGHGLSEAVKKSVSHYVTIPRFGRAESLNAAIAAAIVCDNVRRAQKLG